MPYIFETIRDYITLNGAEIRARFIFITKDLSQVEDQDLLAAEEPNIPRITTTYRFVSNPIEFTKTIVFEPLTVEASSNSKFNTILLTSNGVVLSRYQLGTTVNLTPGIPSIITLGSVVIDFDGRLLEDQ